MSARDRNRPAPAKEPGAEQLVSRRRLLLGSLAVVALLIVGRAVQLQGFEGARWRAEADKQQKTTVPLPARRGAIYDRDGVPLALTRESYAVSIATREVRDRDLAVKRLQEALGLSRSAARRATDGKDPWIDL
ncbi:MAG TPA: hypothetical protein VFR81_10130, partial [Longimicrobium sp.]|nr:hypothetical protein [Longimicrobium sp.]